VFDVVLPVVRQAEPTHIKGLGVVIVMSYGVLAPTNLTGLTNKRSVVER